MQSSYYYVGHFARFVRPGAQRVLCTASHPDLETTAFRNVDGTTAVVLLNRLEQVQRITLQIDATRGVVELPPRSIATCIL